MTERKVESPPRGRGRWQLVAIALLFFLPIAVAWLLVVSDWRPDSLGNHGEFVSPPEPVAVAALAREDGSALPAQALRGRWSMMLVVDGPCDEACQSVLDTLVRVRIALNHDADRVQTLLVLPEAAERPALNGLGESESLSLLRHRGDEGMATGDEAGPSGLRVHLVDPAGERMMVYPLPLDGSGVLSDVRRLLRASDREAERRREEGV
ncbi:hypothetical protein ACN2MM_02000 [Alkalilimnicola ehrlichii MLHE-1]|uniref:Putative transmembrane protein n=1 Tax=Alkalilimnicola ehrlichii (strain ATCC BAA-1101 / DSM 17681 / MLHE-1) TaxID=187272 RepID=Q0ABY3_ALKEH|nr:hypothetical protein [Alkalilimnicola ehrlichii]ABI55654.1 putative transmembrane protein [Alkalilimnicola ehrlichii MLHE-1]